MRSRGWTATAGSVGGADSCDVGPGVSVWSMRDSMTDLRLGRVNLRPHFFVRSQQSMRMSGL